MALQLIPLVGFLFAFPNAVGGALWSAAQYEEEKRLLAAQTADADVLDEIIASPDATAPNPAPSNIVNAVNGIDALQENSLSNIKTKIGAKTSKKSGPSDPYMQ